MRCRCTLHCIGLFKLRVLKGSSQATISLPGSTVLAKNSLLRLKNGWYRKIVAHIAITTKGLFLQEIIEAHE